MGSCGCSDSVNIYNKAITTPPEKFEQTPKKLEIPEEIKVKIKINFDEFLTFLESRMIQKKTIGQGGQGKISKYYSSKFKRLVAEKMISLEGSIRNTLGVRNVSVLVKEAVLLAKLNHQNIVKIYDFKIDPPTIIMEYCEKGSLRKILDDGIKLPMKYKFFFNYVYL